MFAASLVAIASGAVGSLNDRFRYDDGAEHVSMAWNLARYGVLSSRDAGPEAPEPSWRREPLYPALLAGVLALGAQPATSPECIKRSEPACRGTLHALKLVNVAVLLALAVATAWAARALLGPGVGAWGVYLLVTTNGAFWGILNEFRTETAAALALLVASVCFQRLAVGSSRTRDVVGAGLAFGALTLLKAIFFYVGPLMLLLALWIGTRPGGRAAARRLAAALLIAYLPAGAWVARNASHGAGFTFASDRSVLAIRAEYDTMTWREWAAAWFYYSRDDRLSRALLARWFRPEDTARLERSNPDGFYRRAKEDRGLVDARLGTRGPHHRRAVTWAVIREHLPMHVALIGPLAVEGCHAYEPYFRWPPLRWLQEQATPWLVPALLLGTALGVGRRQPERVAFFAPSATCFALHVVATHGIHRYSWPLLPVGAIALFALPALLRGRFPELYPAQGAGPPGGAPSGSEALRRLGGEEDA